VILSAFFGLLLLGQSPSPEQFFIGRTEGQGTAHVILSGRHTVRHRGHGRVARDGALLIEQVVEEEGKPPRRRTWRLVRAGPGHFTGTISDARGPVTGDVRGNVLHIRYRSVEGPSVEQWITVQPGGRAASNRMTFRRFGVQVATMEETIRRVD
jgi:hypothetical protein